MKRIQDAIGYIKVKIFNDKMCARNLSFEQSSKSHDDRVLIEDWLRHRPIEAGELEWHCSKIWQKTTVRIERTRPFTKHGAMTMPISD